MRTLVAKGAQPRLQREHLRRHSVATRPSRLHLILLDTSGSMRRGGRLALAKGHAARLIEQAAKAGDHVALLCFGGDGVELLLPPGPARASGSQRVRPLGGGGGTPLAQALGRTRQILGQLARRQGPGDTWLWLLTDGRSLDLPVMPPGVQRRTIVDFDDPQQPIGRCAQWARAWEAEHLQPLQR